MKPNDKQIQLIIENEYAELTTLHNLLNPNINQSLYNETQYQMETLEKYVTEDRAKSIKNSVQSNVPIDVLFSTLLEEIREINKLEPKV